MKLYSKHRDYYDSAIGFGIDPSIRYLRDQRFVIVPHVGAWNAPQEFKIPQRDWVSDGNTHYAVIGFCGEYFPMMHVEHQETWMGPYVDHYFYTADEYIDWHKVNLKERLYASHKEHVKEFFDAYAGKKTDARFVEIEAPVFVARNHRAGDPTFDQRGVILEVNPILKNYAFYRIKDAFTAFQEISMYLSNQLVKETPIDQISDKYRLLGHGFDGKTSFRHPTKLKDLK